MKKIKVVVSDLGNVLIPFDYNIIINKLNKVEKDLGNQFYKLYRENYHVHRDFEKGKMSIKLFWEIMNKWTNHHFSFEEFAELYSDIFTLNKNFISLLSSIKENYRLILLSNTNVIHQKYGWGKFDFIKQFEKLILSHEVGFAKPESGIYKSVTNYTKEKPEHHLFIDDIKEYCDAAINLGWKAIQFKNENQIISELRKNNIIKS